MPGWSGVDSTDTLIDPRILIRFPNLHNQMARATSPAMTTYNCIAWAAGDTSRWWWPSLQGGYYWPAELPRVVTLENVIAAFALQGYKSCRSRRRRRQFEKVAIYATSDQVPKHAARQLSNGRWTSKLGQEVDIEHETPEALEGTDYGDVVRVMRRRRPPAQPRTLFSRLVPSRKAPT